MSDSFFNYKVLSLLMPSHRDRIEYEEWLLKALDASTAPKIPTRRRKEEETLPLDEDHTVVSMQPVHMLHALVFTVNHKSVARCHCTTLLHSSRLSTCSRT